MEKLHEYKKISNNFFKELNDKYVFQNFSLFILGLIIVSFSINIFYVPNNIMVSGSTGFSILVNNYIAIPLPLIVFVITSILLMIGFAIFGMEYGAKNILGTILFPIFLELTYLINNFINFNSVSLFLLIVMGGVVNGFGFGLIKKSGYSQGGFNVLYDIIHKYFKTSIGKASLICNSFIIVIGVFVFGIDKGIYAMISLYFSTYITDKVLLGISMNKAFYIITTKPIQVKDYIINNLNYTVTIVNARGGYSHKRKKMLLCVIPTIEYTKVKDVIKEIDPNSFFLITDSYSTSKLKKMEIYK